MMKTIKLVLLLTLSLLGYTTKGQFADHYLAQEVYRSGSIISYTRSLDGVPDYEASNESVGNIIYNIGYEQDGVYSRLEFLSVVPIGFLEQDQNQYWSYNFTLGAYLNENPIELGIVSMYCGIGADADLSSFLLDDGPGPKERRSFESGTIGANLRVDLEILDFIQIRNSLTYGWWRPDGATRWDFRSTIGVEIGNGFYPTVAPNFLYIANDKEGDAGQIQEESTQFYLSFGFGIDF